MNNFEQYKNVADARTATKAFENPSPAYQK